MSKKVGLVTYPTSISKIRKDVGIVRAFDMYLRSSSPEYRTFFQYLNASSKARARYEMFFHPDAPSKIRIPPKLQEIADRAHATGDWKDAEYRTVMDFMKQHCKKTLESKAVPGFFSSKAFAEYHCLKVTGSTNPNKAATDAAKKLNLKEKKHVDLVKEIFLEALFGQESKIGRLNKQLEATTAKGSSAKGPRNVYAELKAAKLIRA